MTARVVFQDLAPDQLDGVTGGVLPRHGGRVSLQSGFHPPPPEPSQPGIGHRGPAIHGGFHPLGSPDTLGHKKRA